MSLMTLEQTLKKGQERAVNTIAEVSKHKIADSYYKVGTEGMSSLHDKGVTAGLLNNFAKIMDSDLGQALTTSSDFGPYVMEVWPLVTAWYADFPLKDLISVQDMDKPLAYLFFSLLKTGTNKADTVAGDVVETATGMRTIRGRYPTGEIFGEVINKDEIDVDEDNKVIRVLLAYAPLNVATIPGYDKKIKIDITNDGGVVGSFVFHSVVGNEVHLAAIATPTQDSGITIDITTGLITIPNSVVSSVASVKANYVWNLDYANVDNIPKVKEQVEMRPMEAIPRAIMLEWTIFSEYLKKSQFGQDIRQDNIKRILSLLYQYDVRYILDDMYDYSTGHNNQEVVITIPGSSAISLDVKAQRVMQALRDVANEIELASGRVEGNRIVVGRTLKAFVESLPNTWWKRSADADSYGFSTPRHIGTFGTFEVYYDPTREADEGFMTYRGSEWYDAAYYMGQYMPIVPTDAIALGVTVRSSFCSMSSYKFDKPNCVIRLSFVNE